MLRRLICSTLITGVIATSAKAEPVDLAKLDEVRSLTAEAVALQQISEQGRVTKAFAQALGGDLADGLDKLAREPVLGPLARQAAVALRRRDLARLTALRDQLVQMERSHGRAA